MQLIRKQILPIAIFIFLIISSNTITVAQTPDPGIGGPGSGSGPSGTPSGDGGPVVPFDGGMSLMLAASGVSYVAKKLKSRSLVSE